MRDEAVYEPESPRQRFGAELRRLREAAGLSQGAIAARLQITQTHVSRLEMGKRTPQSSQAETLDHIFGLTDRKYFVGLRERITARPGGPRWFMRWVEEIEPGAMVLRGWDPILIPGLLQTEAYARYIFASTYDAIPEELDDRVKARIRRRTILDTERPPAVWALMDERVLNRRIGSEAVMCEQMDFLLESSQRYNVNIQIVPDDAACTAAISSGFVLAQLPDGTTAVCVESAGRSEVSAEHDLVTHIWSTYDKVRSEACPVGISLKMIKEARDRWNVAS